MYREPIAQDTDFWGMKKIPDEPSITKITANAKYNLAMNSYDEICRESG